MGDLRARQVRKIKRLRNPRITDFAQLLKDFEEPDPFRPRYTGFPGQARQIPEGYQVRPMTVIPEVFHDGKVYPERRFQLRGIEAIGRVERCLIIVPNTGGYLDPCILPRGHEGNHAR